MPRPLATFLLAGLLTSPGAHAAGTSRKAPPAEATASPAPTRQTDPPPEAAPALPPDVTNAIKGVVTDVMGREGIPGLSLAVAYDGQVRFTMGLGLADIENAVPATPKTVYRLASVSKTLTAAAALRLADKGRLDLDAAVWSYCRPYPPKTWRVTARQLLAHQGGIRHYKPGERRQVQRFESIAEGLAFFKDDPLVFEPGTGVLYSTFGYSLLGCVLEGASGQSYADLLREEVLVPIGMTSTGPDDVLPLIAHRARGYMRTEQGWYLNSPFSDVSYKIPGAGLCGTAPDIARFGMALVSGKLLRPKTLRQMLAVQRLRDSRPTRNGLGLGLALTDHGGEREAWHDGGQEQVTTILYTRPEAGLSIAILANLAGVEGLLDLARRIGDLIASGPSGD